MELRPQALPRSISRAQAAWFVGMFVVYLAAGNALVRVPLVESGFIEPWTVFNAVASAKIATALGVETTAADTLVCSGPAQGCSGVFALPVLLVLWSAILAFPAPWSRRLIGVAAGTVAILGFNLLRVVSLIMVARYFPERLEFVRVVVWQILIVLIALALFLAWGVWIAARGSASAVARRA